MIRTMFIFTATSHLLLCSHVFAYTCIQPPCVHNHDCLPKASSKLYLSSLNIFQTISTIKSVKQTSLSISRRKLFLSPRDDVMTLDPAKKGNQLGMENEKESSLTISNSSNLAEPLPLPTDAAKSIEGRLLCASTCAYDIDPNEPYFRGAAFRPSTVAKRISRGVNSVVIGQTFDGITIAFRGTQTSSPLDWIQNAALFLSNIDEDKLNSKGKVHTGFYRAVKSLWKPMKSVILDMIEKDTIYIDEYNKDLNIQTEGTEDFSDKRTKPNIYITGHSKGGAMASIAAVLMKLDPDMPDPTYVCTFASAKVGDSVFRDFYNKQINQTSYEAYSDIIPFLPPSSSTMETMDEDFTTMVEGMLWSEKSASRKDGYVWDYQTVGARRYINENGDIIQPVTKDIDDLRIRDFERKTFLSVAEFRSAHCSSCPDKGCNGLYVKAVANDILCEST